MNATEKKSLEKLIDGDFDIVVGEVQNMAARAQADAERRVRDEYQTRDGDVREATSELRSLMQAHEDSVQSLVRKLTEDKEALFARWEASGLEHHTDNFGRGNTPTIFRPAGLEDALREAQEEVQAQRRAALQEIATRRSAAHRTVLLGGLESPQALALVESIPKASDVFEALTAKALTTGEEG